jgi:hypothetical protein
VTCEIGVSSSDCKICRTKRITQLFPQTAEHFFFSNEFCEFSATQGKKRGFAWRVKGYFVLALPKS